MTIRFKRQDHYFGLMLLRLNIALRSFNVQKKSGIISFEHLCCKIQFYFTRQKCETHGLFTQNLNGTDTRTGTNIMWKFSHCKRSRTRKMVHKHYMYLLLYQERYMLLYWGKVQKWLDKPLVPVLVPFLVSLPLQCENFHTIYSEPIVLVPVPFKFLCE